MNPFFDTHAHIDFPEFDPDREAVLQRAADAGITRIIAIGTDLDSSRKVLELSETHPNVFAVVGWHPGQADEAPDDIREELRRLAAHPRVVALGETGLDYHRLPGSHPDSAAEAAVDADADSALKTKQAQLFVQHLEVAADLGLNCVIHQRDAFDDTLKHLEPFADRVRGVFHCFVDGPPAMRRVVELGSLVSFTGIVTFKNAQTVRDTLAQTPPDRFMLETDCPFLAPVPRRGKRCEPADVRHIAELVASVRQGSIEALSESTCANAARFFPKMGLAG